MHAEAAVSSAIAWRNLSQQERDWLSGCFCIVGLGARTAKQRLQAAVPTFRGLVAIAVLVLLYAVSLEPAR